MDENKIRISAVRYANTYPFLYGFSRTGFDKRVIVTTDHPSECARKLIYNEADIGLIPVAALPDLKEYHIITDYCLGAYGKVKTVMLLSNCPISQVSKVSLDYRSRSSVTLVKILAAKFWKRNFEWKETGPGSDFLNIPCEEAVVLIGDQCFEFSEKFAYQTDLAEEWFKYTGLPFAFACWTSNKKINKNIVYDMNNALASGVNDINGVVEEYGRTGIIRGEELRHYLTDNMDFILNDDKMKAIQLFLKLIKEM